MAQFIERLLRQRHLGHQRRQLAVEQRIRQPLSQAQGAFPPQAQRDIDYARTALQNRDLAAARSYLNAAIADAQQGR